MKKAHQLFRYLSFTLIIAGLSVNNVIHAQIANEIISDVNWQESGMGDNADYIYTGEKFNVGLGDNLTNLANTITFETTAEKQEQSWLSLFTDNQKTISMTLLDAGKYDPLNDQADFSANFDEKINEIHKQESSLINQTKTLIENLTGSQTIEKQTNLSVENDKVIYQDVLSDIDTEYIILDNGIKENIIVKGSSSIPTNTFYHELKLDDGVKFYSTNINNPFDLPADTYYFTDNNDNYLAHFLPIYIYDSNGQTATSDQILFDLIPTESPNTYQIKIQIDFGWMVDNARQYPITIDPTIVHNTNADFAAGRAINRMTFTDGPMSIISPSNTSIAPAGCKSSFTVKIDNTANSENLTDYQVKVTVPYAVGMSSNYSSIRFTNDNGGNLNYWLETYYTSTSANFWVKVDSIPANQIKNIYGFYNGCTGGLTSSDTNTFIDVYNAQTDYSSTQGYRNWYYQYFNGSTYANMTYGYSSVIGGTTWSKPGTWCLVYADTVHPGNSAESTRRWNINGNYSALMVGNVRKQNTNSLGDGVYTRILKNSTYLWNQFIATTDSTGYNYSIDTDISSSDYLYFRLHQNGNYNYDGTYFTPIIRLHKYSAIKPTTSIVNNTMSIISPSNTSIAPAGCKSSFTVKIDNTANSENLTDYQVKVTVPYAVGMSSNYSSIRFTNDNGGNLNYWLETYYTSTSANFWVKVDSIPANQIKNIYGFYNGCTGGLTSSDTNTFIDVYNAQTDYSSTQGYRNWYYQYFNGSTYANMTYGYSSVIGGTTWSKPGTWCLVYADTVHPGNSAESTRRWNINGNYSALMVGNVRKQNTNSLGDGVYTRILKNSTYLWNQFIATTDSTGYNYSIDTDISSSDYLYFRLHQNGNYNYDGTYFTPIIRLHKYSAIKPTTSIVNNTLNYGIYDSSVLDLGADFSKYDKIYWDEQGVQTGDGETPYSTDGLVAQWNFNETSGTTAYNNAGSCEGVCNATLTNMTTTGQDVAPNSGWTATNKRWGDGGLMFDGSNDFISIGHNSNFNLTNSWTVEAWIKRTGPTTTNSDGSIWKFIVRKGTYNTFGLFYNPTSGKVHSNMYNGSAWKSSTSQSVLDVGQWHHIVGVYESNDSGTLKLFFDGALENTTTGVGTPSTNTDPLSIIGTSNISSVSTYWPAILDSTRIYSRALGGDEILSNYQAGNIEIQTRSGETTNPDDGSWDEWKPSGNGTETTLDNVDNNNEANRDTNTKLLIHGDGDNNSTKIFDNSYNKYPLTTAGDVKTKTDQSKFGGSSMYFDGNGDYLQMAYNSDLDLGTKWTVDFWVYPTSTSTAKFLSTRGSSGDGWEISYWGNFVLEGFGSNSGAGVTTDTYPINNWYHIAVVTNNGASKMYVNGQETFSVANNFNWGAGSHPLRIGLPVPYNEPVTGYLDEIRISKGVARWTSNFTPPTSAYNNDSWINTSNDSVVKMEGSSSMKISQFNAQSDANTVALWHLDETSGSGAYIKDSSGNGNDGTPTGTSAVDGMSVKARSFNGSSDYIDVPDTEIASTNYTLSFWAKPTNTTYLGTESTTGTSCYSNMASNRTVLRANYTNAGSITYAGINVGTNGITVCEHQNSLLPYILVSSQNISDWSYITLVNNNNTISLYINGRYIKNAVNTGKSRYFQNYLIGAYNAGQGSYSGYLDEIKIDNIARTADEIAEAYRMGRDHRLTYSLDTNVDLSNNSKLPFYIAADKPGSYLQTTTGESASTM